MIFSCSMLCLEQEMPEHMSLPESPTKPTDSTTYSTPAATTKSAPTRYGDSLVSFTVLVV